MANLNSEDILASSNYVCGERKGTLHARTHSPRRAGPGRGGVKYAGTRHPREWSAEIRLLALWGRGFLLLFLFLVAWLLGLRDMEGPVGFLIRLQREVVGSPIYTTYRLPPK